MIELLGIIGFLVSILIALPATILAFIQVLRHPVSEIYNLWCTLIDELLNIYEDIRNDFKKFKD
jgi:hypothetical protein